MQDADLTPPWPARLIERLRTAGLLEAAPQDFHLLTGGYKNHVWRFGNVVVKEFVASALDDNPSFPNLPEHEALVLQHLKGTALAPEFRGFLPETDEGAVLVYDYAWGKPWSGDTAEIARCLLHLHKLPLPPGLRVLPSLDADVLADGDRVLAIAGGDETLEWLRPKPKSLAPPPPVLAHTDLGPGNIIKTQQGLRIIDWQCPGLGNPVEDMVAFLSPAFMILYGLEPHSLEDEGLFLATYGSAPVVDHFHAVRAAFHWRFACYCIYRQRLLSGEVSTRYARALAAECALLTRLR